MSSPERRFVPWQVLLPLCVAFAATAAAEELLPAPTGEAPQQVATETLDARISDSSAEAPRQVVSETLDAVITILKDPALCPATKLDQIESVAYQRFDFETISRLVLARNWKRLSPQERSDFAVEFKRHLSLTYGSILEEYQDETISIEGARAETRGDFTVRTRVAGASADDVVVDYRLRPKGNDWLVIDVVVEGVSMIQNFRTQTQEVIRDVGTDGLITRMRERNAAREAKKTKKAKKTDETKEPTEPNKTKEMNEPAEPTETKEAKKR